MASIITLKRRIQSAQNVSKTTRAMQMISASKLKKAQEATLSIRPYVDKLTNISTSVAKNVEEEPQHPYLNQKNIINKTLLIILSPDRGLCGGLVTNLIKEFFKYKDQDQKSMYIVVGKKIETTIAKLKNEVLASFAFGNTLPSLDMVFPITRVIDEYYLGGKVDSVQVLSTHFSSIFTQKPKLTKILPITLPEEKNVKSEDTFHMIEPSSKVILPSLLKHYLEMTLYRQLLESYLSEQASRMITMQNATNNANDIIEDLRLEYNKSRQAKITSEILDITGAASTNYE